MDPAIEKITVEKIVHGGMGLARGGPSVILAPGCLPGETLEVAVGEIKQGMRIGRVVNILSPSPDRIRPACPLFLACGGCDFLHTPYTTELDLKQQILAETLERIGKIKPQILPPATDGPVQNVTGMSGVLPPLPSPAPEFYRTFVQLKIDGRGKIGLFRRDSHEVVAFEGDGFGGCRLQHERLNQAVAALQGMPAGYKVIKFRMGDEGFVVNLTADHALPPATDGPVQNATGMSVVLPPNPDLIQKIRSLGATGFLINDQLIFGSPEVLYIYGEEAGRKYHLRVSHDAFFQPNPLVVQSLVKRIEKEMEKTLGSSRLNMNLLDLYAGVGTFGILLAHAVQNVYAAEVSVQAGRDLEFNIEQNNIRNLAFHRGTARSFLKRLRAPIGAAIVDPPRAGLEPEVRRDLARLSSPILFYVSCHPATLARDLAELSASGMYHVDSVQIFDQFGRTHHIESLAVLKKKS